MKGHGVDVGELRGEQGSVMEAPGGLGKELDFVSRAVECPLKAFWLGRNGMPPE